MGSRVKVDRKNKGMSFNLYWIDLERDIGLAWNQHKLLNKIIKN